MIQSTMRHRELPESIKGTYVYLLTTAEVVFPVSILLRRDREGLSEEQNQLRVVCLSHIEKHEV